MVYAYKQINITDGQHKTTQPRIPFMHPEMCIIMTFSLHEI